MPKTILVTSSRMPAVLDEIRKLGSQGHRIFASDTFGGAPGSRSRWVERRIVTASPRHQPLQFLDDVERIVNTDRVDLVLPGCEEVFYLAAHLERFEADTHIFASPLEVLEELHDKGRFAALMRTLGHRVPETVMVQSPGALVDATESMFRYLARPCYSRGGIRLTTNAGPLAGLMPLENCRPDPDDPWIVQEFVDGTDLCTFSVAHHGRITAHMTYTLPRKLEHAGGIHLVSIDDPETLKVAQSLAQATNYHGQFGIDFKRVSGGRHAGLVALECNPRPTAGVTMMPGDMFVKAVVDPDLQANPSVAPAGIERKYATALLRDMFLHPWEIPYDLPVLLSDARDVYSDSRDPMPALYSLLTFGRIMRYRIRNRGIGRLDLLAAYFDDIQWDGQPIP